MTGFAHRVFRVYLQSQVNASAVGQQCNSGLPGWLCAFGVVTETPTGRKKTKPFSAPGFHGGCFYNLK